MPLRKITRRRLSEAESLLASGYSVRNVADRFRVSVSAMRRGLATRRKGHWDFLRALLGDAWGEIIVVNILEAFEIGLLSKTQIHSLIGRWRDEYEVNGSSLPKAFETLTQPAPRANSNIQDWLDALPSTQRIFNAAELSRVITVWLADRSRDELVMRGQVELASPTPIARTPTFVLGAGAVPGSEYPVSLAVFSTGPTTYYTIGHPDKIAFLSTYESSHVTCAAGDGGKLRDRLGLIHRGDKQQLVVVSFPAKDLNPDAQSRPHVFHSGGNRRFKTARDTEFAPLPGHREPFPIGATLDLGAFAERGLTVDGADEWVSDAVPFARVSDVRLTILNEISGTRGEIATPETAHPHADDDAAYARMLRTRFGVALDDRLDALFS